jgi:hypothetical protein
VAPSATGTRLQGLSLGFFGLPPVPSLNRRISRHPVLRHGPLDFHLADSEHGAQKGQHVRVHQIAVRANISKLKFWKYF